MGTKRVQKYLWTHVVSIPNYGRELNFEQVAVEMKDQFQIPYYGVWILDANFGTRWRCSKGKASGVGSKSIDIQMPCPVASRWFRIR
jgi:hypothetical protein